MKNLGFIEIQDSSMLHQNDIIETDIFSVISLNSILNYLIVKTLLVIQFPQVCLLYQNFCPLFHLYCL